MQSAAPGMRRPAQAAVEAARAAIATAQEDEDSEDFLDEDAVGEDEIGSEISDDDADLMMGFPHGLAPNDSGVAKQQLGEEDAAQSIPPLLSIRHEAENGAEDDKLLDAGMGSEAFDAALLQLQVRLKHATLEWSLVLKVHTNLLRRCQSF